VPKRVWRSGMEHEVLITSYLTGSNANKSKSQKKDSVKGIKRKRKFS
jgi:hypothetical protein